MNYVVTGTSRGIGLELVRQLVGRGDRVAACCRRPAEATKLQELSQAHKDAITIVEMDVQDSQSIKVRHMCCRLAALLWIEAVAELRSAEQHLS